MNDFCRYIAFTFLMFFVFTTLSAQTIISSKNVQIKNPITFRFLECDSIQQSYFNGILNDSNSVLYKSGTIPAKLKSEKKMYIFKSYFQVSEDIKGIDLSLFFGTSNLPCEIYLNKQKIDRVGSFKEIYTSQIHFSHETMLPDQILKYGNDSINELCFQYYPVLGETRTLDKMFIASYTKVASYTFWRNFFGINLVQGSMIFAMILFIYFIFGFLLKKEWKEKKYLWFALFCLSYTFSYTNMSFIFDSIPQLNLLRLSRFGLTASNLMLLFFTMEFFNFFTNKKLIKYLLALPSLIFVLIILKQPDVVKLEEKFTVFVTFVNLPYMLFAFVLAIIGTIKQKSNLSIAFLAGFTIFVATIFYDSALFSMKLTPYTWAIPHGYSIFITFIFFILASEQAQIHKVSLNRASALQKMKDNLEILVKERTVQIEMQNEELRAQTDNMRELNNLLMEKNEEINMQKSQLEKIHKHTIESIRYAKRIQSAALPSANELDTYLGEYFVIFKPRDIISGDFYFVKKIDNVLIVAAADCTGHGVPGAFMSILSMALLNEIIRRKDMTECAAVLNELRDRLKNSLQQNDMRGERKEGLDIALCALNTDNMEMQYAGAYNPLWILRNHGTEAKIDTFTGDRMPIGIYPKEVPFTNHYISINKGDTIYIFSDGFESQFGGETGDKMKSKRFQEIILAHGHKPLHEQQQFIETDFNQWKGKWEQVDDILVIGVKV